MFRYSIILLTILHFSLIFGGEVTKIQIKGNIHTKDKIILREILHPIPSEFDSLTANEDRNRIYNLGLFSTVEITNEDSVYLISVVESLRWMPFPIFEHNEAKGKNGWSYGGGVAILNFRGLNEKLYVGGTLGETKSYFFNFIDPWMWGDHGSVNIGISDNTFEDAVYAYELQEKSLSISTGYYKGLHHQFRCLLGLNINTLTDLDDQFFRPIPNDCILEHQHITTLYEYVYDTRDIYTDPNDGYLISFDLTSNFGLGSSYTYHTIDFDFTKYTEIDNVPFDPVISMNTTFLIQFSEQLPIYSKAYLGGEDYVRGYSSIPTDNPQQVVNLIEVENLIFHSLEYQQTLFPKNDLGGVEMGIDFVLFTDFGYGSNNLQKLKISNGLLGYGFGLKFFMSSIGAIGVDFGFNPYKGGFLLHFSMSS